MVKEFLITVLKMEEKRADEVACCIEHIMTLEEISRFQLLTDRCRGERRIKYPHMIFRGGRFMREWLIPLFLLRNPDRGRHRRSVRALTYTVEALVGGTRKGPG